MLEGCTAWPEEFARLYREKGYWQDITLWQMLARVIADAPDKVALVFRDTRMTYRELGERIDRSAAGLAAAGLRPRDRVVLQLPNGLDLIVTFFALTRIGVIPVMALPATGRRKSIISSSMPTPSPISRPIACAISITGRWRRRLCAGRPRCA